MTYDEAAVRKVGERVVAVDAFGRMRCALVAAVPSEWRDRTRSPVVTRRGEFPKMWVHLVDNLKTLPWPIEDVFVDFDALQARVEEIAGG